MTAFEVVRDPVLGESVWCASTARGLRVRVAPLPQFRETAAAVSFAYGSTDLGFRQDGVETWTPAGTAHYLEHKLFEDEDLHTFERFAARGARVNAMTGFARTTYYFTASDALRENLADLLHLVSRAHVTPENVDKERGIIAQEVRMYEDAPEYCTLFDLLGCLYGEHPVRHTVGGTVQSIQEITADLLLACHRAFYRAGNAALAVAGPVDPELVLELAGACALPAGAAPDRLVPDDLGPPAADSRRRAMAVARPKLLLGLKDRTLPRDVEALLRRQLATRVLLERLFGGSSEVREQMRRRGDVDDSLSHGYQGERSFGFAVCGAESDQPDRSVQALRTALLSPVPLEEDHLERVRRRFLGHYVRSFESVRGLCFGHCHEALEGVAPFSGLARVQALTLDEVRARQAELCRPENLAVAVTAGG
jgi:predicted Zn-dependent peptidase